MVDVHFALRCCNAQLVYIMSLYILQLLVLQVSCSTPEASLHGVPTARVMDHL